MAEGRDHKEIDYLNNVIMGEKPITSLEKQTAIEIIGGLPTIESKQNFTRQLGIKLRNVK